MCWICRAYAGLREGEVAFHSEVQVPEAEAGQNFRSYAIPTQLTFVFTFMI
jgi:hypothetical protein